MAVVTTYSYTITQYFISYRSYHWLQRTNSSLWQKQTLLPVSFETTQKTKEEKGCSWNLTEVFGSTMFYYKSVLAWKRQKPLAMLKGCESLSARNNKGFSHSYVSELKSANLAYFKLLSY